MKKLSLTFLGYLLCLSCLAQYVSKTDAKLLRQKEDSLRSLANRILNDTIVTARVSADSLFTKVFVRALKTNNSFYYPFDSLQSISRLYAPDSSFRIITWQLDINANLVIQHGAIQIRTPDGSLKLFPLIDRSATIKSASDTITDNKNWIGAIYYHILQSTYLNKNYYTLLGFDEGNLHTSRKIIEVLTFNEKGEPVFGGDYFTKGKTLVKNSTARYIMEYKREGAPKLNYDDDLGMIVFEHLISETGEPEKKYTLVPDGDYEGFKWANGKWNYIDKIFTQVTPEGQAPSENNIYDPSGNIDQSKLNHNLPPEDSTEQMPSSETKKTKKN
ncbi:hypothetical protein [Ferruginibacter albus]|uniref:hypothetical protein n=1 Tax=Ferruginibacter albus TaxID=2875540 RepID=UPI001CC6E367|nr:hypothetical protein [Ferruginibacter albus]UAY53478.1 hypothetical protein K9M53_07330 [Ferruginibacter albus]